MTITVTFTADNPAALADQLRAFLDLGSLTEKALTLKERVEQSKAKEAFAEPDPIEEARRDFEKAQKAKAKKKAPEPVSVPVGEPDDAYALDEQEDVSVDSKAKATVELLKLKNEQLDRLRDLFNAGKGTYVRDLLKTYGNGAKVFPEVDAAQFPAIKKAIDKELGA